METGRPKFAAHRRLLLAQALAWVSSARQALAQPAAAPGSVPLFPAPEPAQPLTIPGPSNPAPSAPPPAPPPVGAPGFGAPASAVVRNVAGQVDFIDGTPMIGIGFQPQRRVLLGEWVYEGDRLTTDAASEVHLRMSDGGFVALRPSSDLLVRRFRADADAEDISVLSLLLGSLRAITGWIAKEEPARYRIATRTMTIGVRGTDHEPFYIPAGSSLGEPGTYDKVNIGATFMESLLPTPAGQPRRVNLQAGQAAFQPANGREAPRLLPAIPAHFRPTRNEARMAGLHARIQGQLAALRERRRLEVLRRRGVPAPAPAPGAPPAVTGAPTQPLSPREQRLLREQDLRERQRLLRERERERQQLLRERARERERERERLRERERERLRELRERERQQRGHTPTPSKPGTRTQAAPAAGKQGHQETASERRRPQRRENPGGTSTQHSQPGRSPSSPPSTASPANPPSHQR